MRVSFPAAPESELARASPVTESACAVPIRFSILTSVSTSTPAAIVTVLAIAPLSVTVTPEPVT